MRRRRHKPHRLVLMAGVPVLLGTAAWNEAGQPGRTGGELAAAVLSVTLLPVAFLFLMASPAMAWQALVPRERRIEHRRIHKERPPIPPRLRRAVQAADPHCVYGIGCDGGWEFDHAVAWAAGGLTILTNGFGLCHRHNMIKSNYSRDLDGYEHYRPWAGYANIAMARAIYAAELDRKWNLARWWRAAWSLA